MNRKVMIPVVIVALAAMVLVSLGVDYVRHGPMRHGGWWACHVRAACPMMKGGPACPAMGPHGMAQMPPGGMAGCPMMGGAARPAMSPQGMGPMPRGGMAGCPMMGGPGWPASAPYGASPMHRGGMAGCPCCCAGLMGKPSEAPKDKALTGGEAPAEQPKFANATCPIMGTAIDPASVPESLTRMHKGRKVAFCCEGCPPAWDKLSDQEKDKRLAPAEGAR